MISELNLSKIQTNTCYLWLQLELELAQVVRERGDLSNQLSIMARKKEGLNEELIRIRQRLEQANETNSRINRNLEDLVKDCEEKQVINCLENSPGSSMIYLQLYRRKTLQYCLIRCTTTCMTNFKL